MRARSTALVCLGGVLTLLLMLVLAGCAGGASEVQQQNGEEAGPRPAGEAGAESEQPDQEEDEGEEDDSARGKKKRSRREPSTSVSASAVIRGDLVIPVVAEGTIRARHATEIKCEISGRVSEVLVREGQRVSRGTRLVQLDDREYRLALEEAESRYLQALGQLAVEEDGYEDSERAERNLQEQREELARMEREGLITREERRDQELELGMDAVRDGAYRRELLEVRSGLAAARGDATRARLDIERTQLEAPFSGVISDLDLNPGERVQAGETLCRLVDDVNVEAAVGVLESDLAGVRVGRRALLTLPGLGETLEVKVDVVSPDVDADSRTCRVLMRLRSRDGRIKPGMFVRAAIAGEVLEDRLLVPREAILTRDGRPVVFRVEGDRAKWVYVQTGARNDHLVEITRIDQGGPLEPGTLVVVDNHLTLTHDAKIRVKTKVPISDPWAEAAERE